MKRAAISSGALVMILLASACGSDSPEQASGVPIARDSVDPLFSAEFVLFDEDRPTTLTEFAGKPMVVNLWSSWCPNCIAEMPDFELAHQLYGDAVMFIGINVEDDHDAAEELRQATGVTYLLGYDDDGRFPELLGAVGMPSTAFITAAGSVVELWTGQLDLDSLGEKIVEHFTVPVPDAVSGSAGISPEPSDTPIDRPDSGVEAAAATADDTYNEDFLLGGAGAGFVPLDDPVLIEAAGATWLDPDDIVMGIVGSDGEAQAYPVDQMAYHHIANTRLAGEPFVVTY